MDEYEFREGMDRLARIVETNREGERSSTERHPYACMCRMCGHRWNPRTDSVRPRACPACRSTLWDRRNARTVMCFRCGHEWVTSMSHPLRCPACASDKWYLDKVEIRCRICSSRWLDPLAAGKVIRCPVCGPVDRSEVRFVFGKSKTQKKTVVPRGKGAPPAELYRSFADFGNEVVEQEEMVGWGFTPEQAEILHEFMCGMGTVGIAGRHRKSLSEVLDIVSPYISVLRGRYPQ